MSIVLRNSKRNGRAKRGTRPRRNKANNKLVLYKPFKQNNKSLSLYNNRNVEGGSRFLPVNAPVSMGGTAWNGEADIRQNGANSCRIRHMEYIADVTSINGSFNNLTYPVNPGIPTVFRWLNVIASNWEKYRFRKLSFLFRAKSGSFAAGSVMSMVDYDSSDNPPTSKQTMLASNYVDSNTWVSHRYDCLQSNLSDTLDYRYVRLGSNPPNTDIKLYDVGAFNIATDGGAPDGAVGELHVAYDIELKTPQSLNNILTNLGAQVTSGGTLATSIILGTVPTFSSFQPEIVGITVTSPQMITFNSIGTYAMDLIVAGTVLAGTWVAAAISQGVGAFLTQYNVTNLAATLASYFTIFRIDTLPFTMRLPQLTSSTTLINSAVRFAPYAYQRLGD